MSNALQLTLPQPAKVVSKVHKRFLLRGLMGFGLVAGSLMIAVPVARHLYTSGDAGVSKQHLTQIGQALAAYHETYDSLPPAYTVDADGNRLHSWRTLLLPYLGQQDLYDRIDLNKPWNDPVNQPLSEWVVDSYRCRSNRASGNLTNYQVVVGEMTCFSPKSPIAYRDITDGTSNTITVIEVTDKQAVPWMSPNDMDEKRFMDMIRQESPRHGHGSYALVADGSVRFIKSDINPVSYLALITRFGDYFGCDF